MTDTTDILALMADLERLARVATPGKWHVIMEAADNEQGVNASFCIGTSLPFKDARCDEEYIIATQPAAVLALLAHARAETARADAAESDRNGMQRRLAQARKEVDEADEAIEALERDRDADKARIATLVKALKIFECDCVARGASRCERREWLPEGVASCAYHHAACAVADATAGTGGVE